MYGTDILEEFSQILFEISHYISEPYIEKCRFCLEVKIWKLLDLRAIKQFWNVPWFCEQLKHTDYYHFREMAKFWHPI